MKIKFFLASLLGAVLLITSCSKDQESTNVTDNKLSHKQLQMEVDDLTASFIEDAKENELVLRAKPWQKVLGADLKGFLLGAGKGAGIGAAISGVGAGPGALAGGLIEGVASSLVAGDKEGQSGSTTYNPMGNANNVYDWAGKTHYQAMGRVHANRNLIYGYGGIDYRKYMTLMTQELRANGVPCATCIFEAHDVYRAVNNIDFDIDLKTFTNSLTSLGRYEKDLLISYFSALEASTSNRSFANYSILIESRVSRSRYDEATKATLLGVMATARYGVEYWN